MAELDASKKLKKELSLFGVFTLATGATLSSGFFLLPGLAAAQAGSAVIMVYFLAQARRKNDPTDVAWSRAVSDAIQTTN